MVQGRKLPMFNIKENIANQAALWAGADWNDLAAYIGPNAEAFRPTFDRQKSSWAEKGRGPAFQFSWHWPAFIPFLGIPWFAARKQWLMVGTMVGVLVFINLIAAFLPTASFGFLWFLIPMMAKPTYVQMALAKIAKIKAALPPGQNVHGALAEAGGLSMQNGFIAGAICAALLVSTVAMLVFS
jgi:hypothetical protein